MSEYLGFCPCGKPRIYRTTNRCLDCNRAYVASRREVARMIRDDAEKQKLEESQRVIAALRPELQAPLVRVQEADPRPLSRHHYWDYRCINCRKWNNTQTDPMWGGVGPCCQTPSEKEAVASREATYKLNYGRYA